MPAGFVDDQRLGDDATVLMPHDQGHIDCVKRHCAVCQLDADTTKPGFSGDLDGTAAVGMDLPVEVSGGAQRGFFDLGGRAHN